MLDEDDVRRRIREAFVEGGRPTPPLTARSLRSMAGRRVRSRPGVKLPVAVAAAALLVVLVTAGPLRPGAHRPATVAHGHVGTVTYSAYGVQLTVPHSWDASYFPPCTHAIRPGVLAVGLSPLPYFCPAYSGSGTLVELYAAAAPGGWTAAPTHRTVHGIRVLAGTSGGATVWYVPSARAFLYVRGTGAAEVLGTLRRATRGAVRAPGMGVGSEYVDALQRVPVSGPVRIEDLATGRTTVVHAFEGRFTFVGPAGTYELAGSAGDASCTRTRVTLSSGVAATWPAVRCEGA